MESDFGHSVALMCKCGVRRLIILSVECDGILIRAFKLTGLCCGQPGAPNSVVQRLCLHVQMSNAERGAR